MKREPVAIYAAVVAALSAFLGVVAGTDRVSDGVAFWLSVVLAVLVAAGGVLVRGAVTPTVDPRTDAGTPLVPDRVSRIVAR